MGGWLLISIKGSIITKVQNIYPTNKPADKAIRAQLFKASLTSSLRVISLTVLADSIYNILIFFAEKM